MGACSAEGVCGGRNLAKIGFRRPLRVKDSSEAEAGGRSRKPVKQHICCFYWLTRGAGRWRWVEVRRDFIYTNIVGYCGVVRLYVHKRFGWWHVRGAD